jgi:two-component system chemotaxis response regulator CheY
MRNELNTKSLLIVDDSLIIRKAISYYLEDFDLKVVGTATNGETALKLFKKLKPDYVTLDISMPGIDGFQVLKDMVKIDESAKIIVITALADKATGIKALKLGAKNYLIKPFNAEKLKELFKSIG